jgi:hypothetical protein
MVARQEWRLKLTKGDINAPPNVLPAHSGIAEIFGLRAFKGGGLGHSDGKDAAIYEREDNISGRNDAHIVVERIPTTVTALLR